MSVVDQHIDSMLSSDLIQRISKCFGIVHVDVKAVHALGPVFLAPDLRLLGQLSRPAEHNQISTVGEQSLAEGATTNPDAPVNRATLPSTEKSDEATNTSVLRRRQDLYQSCRTRHRSKETK